MGSRYREDNYSSSRGGGERWDRDRLDSYDRQRPPRPPHPPSGPERDPYDDREYYQRTERRDPSPRRERERVIYAERDRYEIPSRPRYRYDDEADRSAGAMVPRPREEEREIDIEIRRREYNRSPPSPLPAPPREFERPRFVRRQSSLDTYDRKPMPKYGDVARVREETVMIPASRHRSPPRYRSPPRFDEYEEIGIDERDREFAGYREREISRVRTRKEGPDYEIEEREEIIEETRNLPKRGKTKMPIRLVNTEVLIKLDYPFEQQVRSF